MPPERFTVFGGHGFIGSHVCAALKIKGHTVDVAGVGFNPRERPLHHVIYCAGLTADFRTRRYDTIEAHVSLPNRILESGTFDSFLYLSSTRVYLGSQRTDEDAPLMLTPATPDSVYNASKIAGEALTLAVESAAARVVRLSNIVGDDFSSGNLLNAVLSEALRRGTITFTSSPASARDYLHVDVAAGAIIFAALRGKERVYNVASGVNVTNAELAQRISELTGCRTEFDPTAPTVAFPVVDTRRLRREFEIAPESLLELLPQLIGEYRRHLVSA